MEAKLGGVAWAKLKWGSWGKMPLWEAWGYTKDQHEEILSKLV